MTIVQKMKNRALGLIRRGTEVAWTPPWMGLGNLLYVGLWAYEAPGRRRVLLDPGKREALGVFPQFRDHLFIDRRQVRITDQRVMPWSGPQPTRPDRYDPPLLSRFIREELLPGSMLAQRGSLSEGTLVVNVRRGDYFSNPHHRAEFGMDQVQYVSEAVARAVAHSGRPERIRVVSDGQSWCREHLGPLLQNHAPVIYQNSQLIDDLAAVVGARRLVITNSTFSYWGGYIGDELYGEREVWAPWLFSRAENGGRAYQLRPSWHMVDEIPGGWSAPPTD